jgi:hypothetical protein
MFPRSYMPTWWCHTFPDVIRTSWVTDEVVGATRQGKVSEAEGQPYRIKPQKLHAVHLGAKILGQTATAWTKAQM